MIPDPRDPAARRPVTLLAPALLLVGVAGLCAACASAVNFREENRDNLEKLHPGMERSEVLDIMGIGEEHQLVGSETQGPVGTGRDTMGVMQVRIPVGGDAPTLYNPHRSETYEAGGSSWEVFFYYTHVAEDDGQVTEEELTPIVLRDGTLTGWGWTHWAAQVGRHDIEAAELPDPLPDPPLGRP